MHIYHMLILPFFSTASPPYSLLPLSSSFPSQLLYASYRFLSTSQQFITTAITASPLFTFYGLTLPLYIFSTLITFSFPALHHTSSLSTSLPQLFFASGSYLFIFFFLLIPPTVSNVLNYVCIL